MIILLDQINSPTTASNTLDKVRTFSRLVGRYLAVNPITIQNLPIQHPQSRYLLELLFDHVDNMYRIHQKIFPDQEENRDKMIPATFEVVTFIHSFTIY
jgi:hypothetical protein